MEHISVKNLEKYQHYKERHMVWLKWHIDCLTDYRFSSLKDNEKWLFIGLVCLACKCDNKIPNDLVWIAKQISSEKSIEKEINNLSASGLLAGCYQNASLDKRREDKKREEESARTRDTVTVIDTVISHPPSVRLTPEQYQYLIKTYGSTMTKKYIEDLNLYSESKPKEFRKYASHKATIEAWMRKDGVKKVVLPTTQVVPARAVDPAEREKVQALINQTMRTIGSAT